MQVQPDPLVERYAGRAGPGADEDGEQHASAQLIAYFSSYCSARSPAASAPNMRSGAYAAGAYAAVTRNYPAASTRIHPSDEPTPNMRRTELETDPSVLESQRHMEMEEID